MAKRKPNPTPAPCDMCSGEILPVQQHGSRLKGLCDKCSELLLENGKASALIVRQEARAMESRERNAYSKEKYRATF